jgi:hypothetical protein
MHTCTRAFNALFVKDRNKIWKDEAHVGYACIGVESSVHVVQAMYAFEQAGKRMIMDVRRDAQAIR